MLFDYEITWNEKVGWALRKFGEFVKEMMQKLGALKRFIIHSICILMHAYTLATKEV